MNEREFKKMQKAVNKLARQKRSNCKEIPTSRRKLNEKQLAEEIDRLMVEHEGEVFIQRLSESILVYFWKHERRADRVVKELEEVIGEEFTSKRIT